MASATSAFSVASPPGTAGNTTCRTVPSGRRSDASAIENSFSVLRCTFLASASIARSTFRRVLIFDTRPMNRSTSASVISVVRDQASAAINVNRIAGGLAAKSDGCEAIARARQEATSRSE
ncbi:hypothetical protein [Nonomuraea dietziae]|uniref:Uncharacterized protein n=1 Tax=Nonomuraea dietziae TaxID=65515 RepID=A0A7W5VKK3_9ACTN|nr:hypothetical protein [Nonomuraea dietziae]MBB3733783.1 hypothetical protein [Nonomuraea dietziae]